MKRPFIKQLILKKKFLLLRKNIKPTKLIHINSIKETKTGNLINIIKNDNELLC